MDNNPGDLSKSVSKGKFEKFGDWLDQARRVALDSLAVLATVLVCFIIVRNAFAGSYLIDSIDVSSALQKDLPDKEAIASQLRDGVGLAWNAVLIKTVVKPIVHDSDEPVIAVSGTNISLQYVASQIRTAFGIPVLRVSGQILPASDSNTAKPGEIENKANPADAEKAKQAGADNKPEPADADNKAEPVGGDSAPPKIRMILRKAGSNTGPFFVEEGLYANVIKRGAIEILAQIDPYAGALALSQGNVEDKIIALMKANSALKDTQLKEEWWKFYRLLPNGSPIHSELPRAELTVANVLLSLGRFSDAKSHFESANNEYRKRTILGTDWYAAVDGLAVIYDLAGAFGEARNKAEQSTQLSPGYASAEYHIAEIEEDELLSLYNDIGPYTEYGDALVKNFCFYERSLFQSSMQQYDKLLDKNPDFLVAYRKIGTMLLNRSIWSRLHVVPSCPEVRGTVSATNLSGILTEAQDALKRARILDPDDAESWLQSANLLYSLQDPALKGSTIDPTERLRLLDEAIVYYKKTSKIVPEDAYFHYCLGRALLTRGQVGHSKPGDPVLVAAIKELSDAKVSYSLDPHVAAMAEQALSEVPSFSLPLPVENNVDRRGAPAIAYSP